MAPEISGVIHLAHPKVSWASPFSKLRSNLLEDVLGLEGDHTGLMFEFSDGVLELGLIDILQNPFGIPPPVENLRFRTREGGGLFSVDLVVLESDVAPGGYVDPGSFSDLELGLGGATGSGNQKDPCRCRSDILPT